MGRKKDRRAERKQLRVRRVRRAIRAVGGISLSVLVKKALEWWLG